MAHGSATTKSRQGSRVTGNWDNQRSIRLKIRRIHLIAGIITIGIIVLLIPIEKTVSPEAHIQVIGETGLPASGVTVEQEWADYSLSKQMHFASVKTDGGASYGFHVEPATPPCFGAFLVCCLNL
jgi:hypothetical protein